MIKPRKLKPGDKIAVVSLSWGGLGDPELIHKFYIAEKRLEEEFGLSVECMPNALKGSEFIYEHPELRASDLMRAFEDKSISAIICAIGGDDTVRILPYVNFDIIKNNPKIFMGYSDTTINHLMMYKAGLVSYYGPSVMCEFGEYVRMPDYTKNAVKNILFKNSAGFSVKSSSEWSDDYVVWDENNINVSKKMRREKHGYEILQGFGTVSGHLLGGCIDVFPMAIGTKIWPDLEQWRGAILFIETSEEKPTPSHVKYILRGLAAQGIFKRIKGIIVGKPQGEVFYEEYKSVLLQVVYEEGLTELPILYNVNIGHAYPIGILPYGINIRIDCTEKTLTFLESAVL